MLKRQRRIPLVAGKGIVVERVNETHNEREKCVSFSPEMCRQTQRRTKVDNRTMRLSVSQKRPFLQRRVSARHTIAKPRDGHPNESAQGTKRKREWEGTTSHHTNQGDLTTEKGYKPTREAQDSNGP